MGSLDLLGMPLSTDVLSGERADDGLYIPIIDRIRSGLNKSGLLDSLDLPPFSGGSNPRKTTAACDERRLISLATSCVTTTSGTTWIRAALTS